MNVCRWEEGFFFNTFPIYSVLHAFLPKIYIFSIYICRTFNFKHNLVSNIKILVVILKLQICRCQLTVYKEESWRQNDIPYIKYKGTPYLVYVLFRQIHMQLLLTVLNSFVNYLDADLFSFSFFTYNNYNFFLPLIPIALNAL